MGKKKIAICFWGLTRNLKLTINNIKKVIDFLLTRYEVDIYCHTYAIYRKYTNIRAKEIDIMIDNNEYKLLNTINENIKTYFYQDDMDRVDINFGEYYSQKDPYNTNYETVKNLLLGMYSLKKVTKNMLLNHLNEKYDFVLYMRPDVNFEESVPLDIFLLVNDKTIILPEFHSWYYKNGRHYLGEGINDRFAVCNPITAIIYGLRFDGMLEYSKKSSLHSETYLKSVFEKSKIEIIKDARICFNRIRINNIELKDCVKKEYIMYLYLEKIIDLINKIDRYEIPKIDKINFGSPEYKILKNPIYEFEEFPKWTNIKEFIKKNDFIIDKTFNVEKYGSSSVSYIYHDFKLKTNHFQTTSLNVGNTSKNMTTKINEITLGINYSVNFESLKQVNKFDYDITYIYETYPIKDNISSLIDDRIEQKRLKRNIEKLITLQYLKEGGSTYFLISHLFNESTQEILIILSYLFEKCIFIKPILDNLASNSTYIYAYDFNKKKYNEIKKEIDIKKFEEKGDITKLASLGIIIDKKEEILKFISHYAHSVHDINNLIKQSIVGNDDLIQIIANILYGIGIAIKPVYINSKFKKYNSLYEICSINNLTNIYLDIENSIIIEMIDIYKKNNIKARIMNNEIDVMFDIMIIKTFNNIVNRLQLNKYVYIEDKKNTDDRFIKIDENIYQKIK